MASSRKLSLGMPQWWVGLAILMAALAAPGCAAFHKPAKDPFLETKFSCGEEMPPAQKSARRVQ